MSLPQPFYDAAANEDDSYAELVAGGGHTWFHYVMVMDLDTHEAMLSLDGGVTDHIPVPAVTVPIVFCIPDGFASLHAKNLTATEDYAELRGAVW